MESEEWKMEDGREQANDLGLSLAPDASELSARA